ncbi:putative glycoprotein [Cytorhabdovirus tiliae]|uniref:Glycoprotein n=1 Tax=Cytorhabdovirus sp. 'tiliae' TaxID=3004219 RepID=A0A9J7CG27_9RHAB|nr:putative glycoprotein [Cytorhabdovirus tiliae]
MGNQILHYSLFIILTSLGFLSNAEVPPLYTCHGSGINSNEIPPFCHSLCHVDWTLSHQQHLEIFNKIAYVDIKMGICTAKREKWVFSESYLWTKTHTMESSVDITPNIDKCKELWSEKCPGGGCHLSSKKPEESYSYGSDTYVTNDHYQITEYTAASIALDQGERVLIFDHFRAKVADGFHFDAENNRYYMWDHTEKSRTDCPYSGNVFTLGYKNDTDSSYWVPDLGIILKAPFPSFIDRHCGDKIGALRPIFISSNGILFANAKEGDSPKPNRIVSLSGSYSDNEKLIVNSFNNIEMMKDRQTCLSRCMLSNKDGLHVTGIGAIATEGSTSYVCPKVISCTLDLKPLVCKIPFMLKLRCMQHQFWWDPSKSYVKDDQSCQVIANSMPKIPMRAGIVTLNGSGIYFNYPKSVESLHPDIFQRNHIGEFLYETSEVKVRDNIKIDSSIEVDTINSSNYTVEHSGWTNILGNSVTWVSDKINSFTGWLGDEIKMLFIVVIVIVSGFAGYKIMKRDPSLSAIIPQVIYSPVPSQGSNQGDIYPKRIFREIPSNGVRI